MGSHKEVLGIDIGTSYLKALCLRMDGTVTKSSRVRSPLAIATSGTLADTTVMNARCINDALRNLLRNHFEERPEYAHLAAICVTSVTPTLTIFDIAEPETAYFAPYWINHLTLLQPDLQGQRTSRVALTRARVDFLRRTIGQISLKRPALTDLTGYINYRLTGELTINTVAAVEFGVSTSAGEMPDLKISGWDAPLCVTPANSIGLTASTVRSYLGLSEGIVVCGGCSDSVASILASGALHASDVMLYLGSFGSLLRLNINLESLLTESCVTNSPYTWLLSVPSYGQTLEHFAADLLPEVSRDNQLQYLDRIARTASPGANGTLLILPRWMDGMECDGQLQLLSRETTKTPTPASLALAALEALGYAIVATVPEAESAHVLYAAGGGSGSLTLVQAIANVLSIPTAIQEYAGEALGSAVMALMTLSGELPEGQKRVKVTASTNQLAQSDIGKNIRLAMMHYESRRQSK